MAVNAKHIKVLFRKDMLTLKRNWSFLLMFVVLPIALMTVFGILTEILAGKVMPEKHNFEYSTWTKHKVVWRSFMKSDMTNLPPSWEHGLRNVSLLFGCGLADKRSVGMVSSE